MLTMPDEHTDPVLVQMPLQGSDVSSWQTN